MVSFNNNLKTPVIGTPCQQLEITTKFDPVIGTHQKSTFLGYVQNNHQNIKGRAITLPIYAQHQLLKL